MELAVYWGAHCFGVARGAVLGKFLRRALAHAMAGIGVPETPPRPFTDSDCQLVRMLRTKDR